MKSYGIGLSMSALKVYPMRKIGWIFQCQLTYQKELSLYSELIFTKVVTNAEKTFQLTFSLLMWIFINFSENLIKLINFQSLYDKQKNFYSFSYYIYNPIVTSRSISSKAPDIWPQLKSHYLFKKVNFNPNVEIISAFSWNDLIIIYQKTSLHIIKTNQKNCNSSTDLTKTIERFGPFKRNYIYISSFAYKNLLLHFWKGNGKYMGDKLFRFSIDANVNVLWYIYITFWWLINH